MIPLVSPCHHNPLEILNVEEIGVEQLDDFDGEPVRFILAGQCCGDIYRCREEAESRLTHHRKAVYNASVKAAWERLEQRHEMERELLMQEVEEFADSQNPDTDRVYVAGVYGQRANGSYIGNTRLTECDTLPKAMESARLKAERLLAEGHAELVGPIQPEQGKFFHRVFFKEGTRMEVAVWSHALGYSSGSGSSECEGAYLSAY